MNASSWESLPTTPRILVGLTADEHGSWTVTSVWLGLEWMYMSVDVRAFSQAGVYTSVPDGRVVKKAMNNTI